MDPNHQPLQLHPLAQPRRQSSQQSLHHHHQHQQQQQQQLQQQQQQQIQQLDATPQVVLAEARKNLQVLIDSGLSKDLLHQWVDDSLSLQLSFPGQPSLAHTLAPSASPSSSPASTPIPSPLLSHPVSHVQSHVQPHAQLTTLAAPPPPPPQCAPPPIPTLAHNSPVSSVSATSTTTSPAPISRSANISTSKTEPAPAVPPINIIKSEPSFSDDVASAWAAVLPQAPPPGPPGPPVTPSHDQVLGRVANPEPPVFMPPAAPFLNHRPRISVCSTSSGSSGRASIWSVNSAQSSLSWQSASSSRTQAPLPMPPMPSASTSANKQNIYWCTSCETSFKRKYDWKRHEDEFHERWRKYPCPEPGCNRSFWGSNSFNQHHKQCHGCKTCPHAEKVVKFLRKRKYWACGFCSALHPARERHVEHVARHFESGLTKGDWMHSRVVYGLLHQPLIHGAWDALVSSRTELGGRRPQFSWHPSRTGRAQGFLEKENPGQLQDLLEFFSGDEGEAQWIVTVAYDLADVVLTTPPVQQHHFPHEAMGPPPPYQQHHDPRMSFAPLPSQAPQQMLTSPVTGPPSPFNSSPYRTPAFVPSQAFPMQQPSPESSAHSPMTASHSPMVPSQAHLEKRELPPVPPQQHGPDMGEGMMDFDYTPAPVIFEDWESIASSTMLDTTSHHHHHHHQQQQQQQPHHHHQHHHQQQQQQQQHQHNQGTHADWGMSQYFGDPRVTS